MIKPLGERIVIKLKPAQTKSSGGIILPTSTPTNRDVSEGKIIFISEEIGDKVKVGDDVIYDKYAGIPFKMDNDESDYIIVRIDDILGII